VLSFFQIARKRFFFIKLLLLFFDSATALNNKSSNLRIGSLKYRIVTLIVTNRDSVNVAREFHFFITDDTLPFDLRHLLISKAGASLAICK